MGVAEDVLEKYPSLYFLMSHPEIGPLLTQAVNPQTGFSPQTFQAKLYQTNWWKSQSETQRNWLIKSNTDPGSANQERSSYRISLGTAANAYGTSLNAAQLKFLSEAGLAHGWAPDGPEMLDAIRKLGQGKPSMGKGAKGVAATEIRALANGQWYQNPSMNDVTRMAEAVAVGRDSLESINARLALSARTRYPHLADQIKAGQTLAQITAPLREVVANELERTPESIQIAGHPVWRQLLVGIQDPASKKMRPMTESEAMRLARRQPDWWKTSNGRQSDAGMARTLLTAFGRRA